jgi:hypothetical protein
MYVYVIINIKIFSDLIFMTYIYHPSLFTIPPLEGL